MNLGPNSHLLENHTSAERDNPVFVSPIDVAYSGSDVLFDSEDYVETDPDMRYTDV